MKLNKNEIFYITTELNFVVVSIQKVLITNLVDMIGLRHTKPSKGTLSYILIINFT